MWHVSRHIPRPFRVRRVLCEHCFNSRHKYLINAHTRTCDLDLFDCRYHSEISTRFLSFFGLGGESPWFWYFTVTGLAVSVTVTVVLITNSRRSWSASYNREKMNSLWKQVSRHAWSPLVANARARATDSHHIMERHTLITSMTSTR